MPARPADHHLRRATHIALNGTLVERDEIDSASLLAGISRQPLVVEFSHHLHKRVLDVVHLAESGDSSSDALCVDVTSGRRGWRSSTGMWAFDRSA